MLIVVISVVDIQATNIIQKAPEGSLGHIKLRQQVQAGEHERDDIVQIRVGEIHHVKFPAIQHFFGDLAGELDVRRIERNGIDFTNGAEVLHVLFGIVAGGVGLYDSRRIMENKKQLNVTCRDNNSQNYL